MDETYVINQVKEDACFVSTNFKEDMNKTAKKWPDNHIILDYVLPDFTTIRRGHSIPIDQSTQNDYVCFCYGNESNFINCTVFIVRANRKKKKI